MITLWNKFFKPFLIKASVLWRKDRVAFFLFAVEGILGLSFVVHFGALLVGKPYSNRFYEWEGSLVGMHPLSAFITLPVIAMVILLLVFAFHFFYDLGKRQSIL